MEKKKASNPKGKKISKASLKAIISIVSRVEEVLGVTHPRCTKQSAEAKAVTNTHPKAKQHKSYKKNPPFFFKGSY